MLNVLTNQLFGLTPNNGVLVACTSGQGGNAYDMVAHAVPVDQAEAE